MKDLTDQKFGRLTAIKISDPDTKGRRNWVCACNCGNTIITAATHLKKGHTKSCGCLRRESGRFHAARVHKSNVTHGKSKTLLYKVCVNMMSRCNNPRTEGYCSYGGRGIKFLFESAAEAMEYITSELGQRPGKSHSIDRINNEGNYERGNLRWATPSEQGFNRRSPKCLERYSYSQLILELEKRMKESGMIRVPMLAHAIGTLKLGCQ